MNALRSGGLLTQRELLRWIRQPATPLLNLVFSVMQLLIFGVLFGGSIVVPGGDDYIGYLVPGLLTLTVLFGLSSTQTAMTADATRGITDRLRAMPMNSSGIVLGRGGADLLMSAIEFALLLAVGLLLGWRASASPAAILLGLLLLLWLRFALLWVGVFFALTLKGPAQVAIGMVMWPVGFVSTVFVSPERLPAGLAAVAEWNPLSATATAVRQLFGNPTGVSGGILAEWALPLALLWPLALTAVLLPLSAHAYRNLSR